MKKLVVFIFIFWIFLLGCKNSSKKCLCNIDKVISKLEVPKDQLVLNANEGNWYYKNQLFNGYMVCYHSNGSIEQKVGFYCGKKEGIANFWFSDGTLKIKSNYHQNVLVGSYKVWWPNGVLASTATYKKGKLNGVEKRWYNSGQLAKMMHYVDENEEGMQKAWLQNGKLYVNYEAKNGRVFGMKKANLCYQLKNEVVIK